VTYLYHDHLGSAVASSEQESARYWPYGDARTGDVSTAYKYTGQELDAASGLVLLSGQVVRRKYRQVHPGG